MTSYQQRLAQRARQYRERQERNDQIAAVVGASAFLGAIGGFAFWYNDYTFKELSEPAAAREAVLDAGYTQPRYIGVASREDCNINLRQPRYYRDAFQAVAPNGRTVKVVVCREERSSAASVRVSASARYRY